MGRLAAGLIVAAISLGAVGCASRSEARPVLDDLGTVADFKLIDQRGHTITRSDLLGTVWVASFVFTRCATVCPQITAQMTRLQTELDHSQPNVRLVSFTVDPENDTPGVLRKYAETHGADPERWVFVTGPQEKVYRLILDSFHLGVQENTGNARTPGNEVTHSTRLALVDKHGHIRGYFDGRQTDDEHHPVNDLPRLEEAIRALAQEK